MINTLIQLALFTAQTFVIVVAILIVFACIVGIAAKTKFKAKSGLKIRKLNKYYKHLAEKMQGNIFGKKALKKYIKEQKAKEKQSKKKGNNGDKNIFILNFQGDLRATAVNNLREEITALLTVAKPTDEVFVKLESAGGVIHGYGLAASELQRIKKKNIPLTICVDKIAASGGYMMACVADKILAAPFAIVGSIGVVAQLPNFNKLLKRNDIEFEQITAGEYKRTLTLFGENTKKGREKFQEDVDDAHKLFKAFIHTNRAQVDLEKIATGEHWFATRALDLKLVDELTTSDDYLMDASKSAQLFEVTYQAKKKRLIEKLTETSQSFLNNNTWI